MHGNRNKRTAVQDYNGFGHRYKMGKGYNGSIHTGDADIDDDICTVWCRRRNSTVQKKGLCLRDSEQGFADHDTVQCSIVHNTADRTLYGRMVVPVCTISGIARHNNLYGETGAEGDAEEIQD